MISTLRESLERAQVMQKGDYRYFIHPFTDGVPALQPDLLREIVRKVERIADLNVDKIVAIEAMGIHIATALSLDTEIPVVIVRKKSYRLPGEIAIPQHTGYSEDTLFLNGINHGDRVLVIDDVISTGGTLLGTLQALQIAGARIIDAVAVIERGDGVRRLQSEGYTIKTIIRIDVGDRVRVLSFDQGTL